jgi:hypothetical protein
VLPIAFIDLNRSAEDLDGFSDVSRLVRAGSIVRVPYSDMDLQSSGIDGVGGLQGCVMGFLYCGHSVLLIVWLWLVCFREG